MAIYGFGKNKIKVQRMDADEIVGPVSGDVTTNSLNFVATAVGTAPSATKKYVPIKLNGVKFYIEVLASA